MENGTTNAKSKSEVTDGRTPRPLRGLRGVRPSVTFFRISFLSGRIRNNLLIRKEKHGADPN